MSCLIIKNDGIGDLILTSGVIAEISKIFRGELDLITCESNSEIAENLLGIRNCFYVSRDELQFDFNTPEQPPLVPIIKGKDKEIIERLCSITYEHVICLRRFIRASSLILMSFAKAKHKHCAWQFPTNTSHEIAEECTKGWQPYSGDLTVLSELSYYQNFIENIFNTKIHPYPRLLCTKNLILKPRPMSIGIGLGGQSSRWPIEHWIKLLHQLDKAGWNITLFGGKTDEYLIKKLGPYCQSCTNLIGRLSFSESVVHLKKLSYFIGNDTSFFHFASLVVPKCLLILGGGTFKRFLPWPNTQNQYVIYHALECFDCDWVCKFNDRSICLRNVLPSDVLEYLNAIANSKKTKKLRNVSYVFFQKYQVAWQRLGSKALFLSFPESVEIKVFYIRIAKLIKLIGNELMGFGLKRVRRIFVLGGAVLRIFFSDKTVQNIRTFIRLILIKLISEKRLQHIKECIQRK